MNAFQEMSSELTEFYRASGGIDPFEGTGTLFRCTRHTMAPEVERWCRERFGRPLMRDRPHSRKAAARCSWGVHERDLGPILFFRRANDALEFKMRWC